VDQKSVKGELTKVFIVD
jgi:hypothetical protein